MGHHWGPSPVKGRSSFLQDGNAELQECLFGLFCPKLTNFHQFGDLLFLGTLVNYFTTIAL